MVEADRQDVLELVDRARRPGGRRASSAPGTRSRKRGIDPHRLELQLFALLARDRERSSKRCCGQPAGFSGSTERRLNSSSLQQSSLADLKQDRTTSRPRESGIRPSLGAPLTRSVPGSVAGIVARLRPTMPPNGPARWIRHQASRAFTIAALLISINRLRSRSALPASLRQQLLRLEDDVGGKLFRRTTRASPFTERRRLPRARAASSGRFRQSLR